MSDNDTLRGELVAHKYRISASISRGSRFDVLLAQHVRAGLPVAIKILRADLAEDQELANSVESEFKSLSWQVQRNLAPVYDVGRTTNGLPYAAMAFVEGLPLSQWLRRKKEWGQSLTIRQSLSLVRQIALGLVKLHESGITHRDLSPDNVLVSSDATPVIVGIGMPVGAVIKDSQKEKAAAEPYIAPEVNKGASPNPQSNIYSLGVLLVELLRFSSAAGRRPALDSERNGIAEGLPENLSAQTALVIDTCLRQEPGERYQSTEDLIEAIDQALAAESDSVFSRVTAAKITTNFNTLFVEYRRYIIATLPIILLFLCGLIFLLLRPQDNLFADVMVRPTVSLDRGATAAARATRAHKASGNLIELLEPAKDATFEPGSELRFYWCWVVTPLENEEFVFFLNTENYERRLDQPVERVDAQCYETVVNSDEFEGENRLAWQIQLIDRETESLVAISEWRTFYMLTPELMATAATNREATSTSTATATYTPSPTNTSTYTPTPTPSETPTSTPTATRVPPTATPTPSETPTNTPTPTETPRPPKPNPPTATPRPPDPTPTPP